MSDDQDHTVINVDDDEELRALATKMANKRAELVEKARLAKEQKEREAAEKERLRLEEQKKADDAAKKRDGDGKAKKGKAKETSSKPDTEHLLEIEDDGEYGGEGIGRVVWEWFENHLKIWEAKEKEMGREAKPPST